MPDDLFETSDFGPTVFLLCDDRVRLVNIRQVTPQRAAFVLSPSVLCSQLNLAYQTGQALVKPRLFYDKSRYLKGLLHGLRRGERL